MIDFREWVPYEASSLGLTIPGPHQGAAGVAVFSAGYYPACSKHGAMNKVSAEAPLWRCLQCNIGVEVHDAEEWAR